MKYYYTYKMDFGDFDIAEEDGKIVSLSIHHTSFDGEYKKEETKIINQTAKELEEYFKGKRKVFTVPVSPKGTDFQKKVWNELINIPYGETRTYGEIAKSISNDNGARAVGNANNKNPIMIIIPCHRVIGSDGKMVGYANGIDMKEKLLKLEKAI